MGLGWVRERRLRWGRMPGGRAFGLLWAGQTVSEAGSSVSYVALPLLAVTRLHASVLGVSAIEAVTWVPAVIIGLHAGALADRARRKRRVMMAACLGQAAAIGTVPALAGAGVLRLPGLLGAAFASGLFGVFFQTAYQPFLRALVPPEDLVAANGRLQGSTAAAQTAGPGAGGLLVQAAGAAAAVIADAASYLVALGVLALIRGQDEKAPAAAGAGQPGRRPLRADIRDGLRYLAGEPVLRAVALLSAAANLLLTAVGALLVVFLVRAVGVPAAGVGGLLAVISCGGVAGALSTGWLHRVAGTAGTARFALAATAPFALLIPLTRSGAALAFFAVGGFACCFGLTAVSVAFASIRQAVCPPGRLGRVTAASRLLTAITVPAGALAAGALGQHAGIRTALVAAAALYTVTGFAAVASPLRRAPDLAGARVQAAGPGAGSAERPADPGAGELPVT